LIQSNNNENNEHNEEDDDDKDSLFEKYIKEEKSHFIYDFLKLFKYGVRNKFIINFLFINKIIIINFI